MYSTSTPLPSLGQLGAVAVEHPVRIGLGRRGPVDHDTFGDRTWAAARMIRLIATASSSTSLNVYTIVGRGESRSSSVSSRRENACEVTVEMIAEHRRRRVPRSRRRRARDARRAPRSPNSMNRPGSAASSTVQPKSSSTSHMIPSLRGAVDASTVSPISEHAIPDDRVGDRPGDRARAQVRWWKLPNRAASVGGAGNGSRSDNGSGSSPRATVSATSIGAGRRGLRGPASHRQQRHATPAAPLVATLRCVVVVRLALLMQGPLKPIVGPPTCAGPQSLRFQWGSAADQRFWSESRISVSRSTSDGPASASSSGFFILL